MTYKLKSRSLIVGILFSFLVCCIMSLSVNAERSLYIGDMVRLELDSVDYSKEDIQSQLDGFELVDFEVNSGKTILTLRCLEIGTKSIKIDNQEIEITVASALEDVQRDTIYGFDSVLNEPKWSVPWLIIELFSIGVFLVTGGIVLIQWHKNKKLKELSDFSICIATLKSIDLENQHCLAQMTIATKNYVQREFSTTVIGKTTQEFKDVFEQLQVDQDLKLQLYEWFNESDYYKFSGVTVPMDKKEYLRDRLIQIVHIIEQQKKEFNEGGGKIA